MVNSLFLVEGDDILVIELLHFCLVSIPLNTLISFITFSFFTLIKNVLTIVSIILEFDISL